MTKKQFEFASTVAFLVLAIAALFIPILRWGVTGIVFGVPLWKLLHALDPVFFGK